METKLATDRLGALAQDSRLAVFRRLIRRGPEGMAPGEIAEALGIPAPTLSFHLAQLARAGLVTSRREGRSILYAANFEAMHELVAFLYANCCGEGSCSPVAAETTAVQRKTRRTR